MFVTSSSDLGLNKIGLNKASGNNVWIIFTSIALLGMLITCAGNYLLLSDQLYFNALDDQLSFEQIKKILAKSQSWELYTYAALPLIYLIRFSVVACCICLGYYSFTDRWSFKPFFKATIEAELFMFLPYIGKICWFLFVKTDYNLNDLTLFYPLSALNLVDAESVPRYWLAPLQTLNLFEVAYWFLLAYGVADVTGFSFKRSFGLVMSSYGVGLVLWVVLVMFLTITYS